jgi:hypothetical protein
VSETTQKESNVSIFERFTVKARYLRYEVDWTMVTVLIVIGVCAFGMLLLIISLHENRLLLKP